MAKYGKLIGKGSFTKAYLNNDGFCYLVSSCPIKECMAFNWLPDHELFPVVECIDSGVYKMEYYPRTKGLKAFLHVDQWEVYKELRRVSGLVEYSKNIHNGYSLVYKAFEQIKFNWLRELMLEALDGCSNIGSDIGFEISPRNVAVKDGQLILLDVFFSKSKLKKVYGF